MVTDTPARNLGSGATRGALIYLLAAGATTDQAAATLGLNKRTAHRLAQQHGIPRQVAAFQKILEQENERVDAHVKPLTGAYEGMARVWAAVGRFSADEARERLSRVVAVRALADELLEPNRE